SLPISPMRPSNSLRYSSQSSMWASPVGKAPSVVQGPSMRRVADRRGGRDLVDHLRRQRLVTALEMVIAFLGMHGHPRGQAGVGAQAVVGIVLAVVADHRELVLERYHRRQRVVVRHLVELLQHGLHEGL